MNTTVDPIVVLLERIAVALEIVAGNINQTSDARTRTEFPWDRVSVRCRKYLRLAVQSDRFGYFEGRMWPLSCEDLMEIGFHRLIHDMCIRNWGRKSAEEIVPLMASLGFDNWSSI